MKDVSHAASTAQQPDSRRLPESSQESNFSSLHAAPRQEALLGLTVGPAAALPAGGGTVEPPRPTPQEHSLPDGHDGITEMTDATEGPSSLRTYTRKRCRLTVDDVADDANTLETGTSSQDEGLMNGEGNAADDATMDEHLEDHGWTLPRRRRRPKAPRGSHLLRFDLEKFTVIIQLTGPVDLTKVYDSTIYRQLLEAAGSQAWRTFRSSRSWRRTRKKIKVNVYRATTGAMPRGVIHGVEAGKTAEDVRQNSHADFHDITSLPYAWTQVEHLHEATKVRHLRRNQQSRAQVSCQQQFCVNCRAEDNMAFSRECPAKLKADRKRQQRARERRQAIGLRCCARRIFRRWPREATERHAYPPPLRKLQGRRHRHPITMRRQKSSFAEAAKRPRDTHKTTTSKLQEIKKMKMGAEQPERRRRYADKHLREVEEMVKNNPEATVVYYVDAAVYEESLTAAAGINLRGVGTWAVPLEAETPDDAEAQAVLTAAKLKKMRTRLPQKPYPIPTRGLRRYQTELLRRVRTGSAITPYLLKNWADEKKKRNDPEYVTEPPSCNHCKKPTRPDVAHLLWECEHFKKEREEAIATLKNKERPGDLGAWIRPPEEDEETRLRLLRSVVLYMEKTGLSQSF
ncbi:hypothetical protein HPB47_000021 [Ixodes persulcatus]|uniref:Uncharacterized protein n=1 Tax=Ixodes persulcatus TaxID=34615 RepID=A0AC60PUF4_IXOPE|nr:hypothetical protein HPB47_000021 [Ixodes persulcatus]